jgi:hypothetical protein
MSESQMKTMLITSFEVKGIVHFEFVPQDQTANQPNYVEILKQLCVPVHRERPELWPDWILHHDSAPAHRELSSSCWPKSGLPKWNTHPVPLIYL